MLKSLEQDKIELIIEYCKERFGIKNKILSIYNWYVGSKNRIYITTTKEIDRIKPESIGLCIFRLDKTPKPTTNFIQLFGKRITKNFITLDKKKTLDFCKGSDLKIETQLKPGFVSIKYQNISLGCGHWNGTILKNQMPKSKFCKINFF